MTIALILHEVDKNRLIYTSTINHSTMKKKMLKGTDGTVRLEGYGWVIAFAWVMGMVVIG